MTRLPVVTAKDAIRALERAGFVLVRTSGSHQRFVHSEDPSRATTVPAHAGKTLKRGTLRNIIKEAGLTVEEFTAFCEHGVQHSWRTHSHRRCRACGCGWWRSVQGRIFAVTF